MNDVRQNSRLIYFLCTTPHWLCVGIWWHTAQRHFIAIVLFLALPTTKEHIFWGIGNFNLLALYFSTMWGQLQMLYTSVNLSFHCSFDYFLYLQGKNE